MKKLFLCALAAALFSSAQAEAASGIVLRLEAFKASDGTEFLFIWGAAKNLARNFCITEPLTVRFILQPEALPQEFSWVDGVGVVTLKLHRKELAKPQLEADLIEFCD